MTRVRPEPTSLRRWHAQRERALDLLSLDDATWEALSSLRRDFTLAKSLNDDEALLRFVDYGAEMLTPPEPNAAETDWIDWTVEPDPQRDADRDAFLHRYARARAASPLRTQRQIADAAGLSPTTVHAIEAGRIRPQFRTVEKLATAFGIAVTDLLDAAPANNGHPTAGIRGEKRRSPVKPPKPDRSTRPRVVPPAPTERAG